MFQRLSGNFLNKCFGVNYDQVIKAEGSMPTDYKYLELKGFVSDVSEDTSYIEPVLPLKLGFTTVVVINPSIEVYRHTSIVEPEELIYAVSNPDISVDDLDWVFRLYSVKR